MIAGAVLTETVFAWPGLGRLTFDAIHARDYPLLMGMFIFIRHLVIVGNLITDILYAILDPRIRYQLSQRHGRGRRSRAVLRAAGGASAAAERRWSA